MNQVHDPDALPRWKRAVPTFAAGLRELQRLQHDFASRPRRSTRESLTMLVRRTWIPAVVFGGIAAIVGWWLWKPGWWVYHGLAAAALTPLLWPCFVRQRTSLSIGGGVAAGIVIGAISQVLPTILMLTWSRLGPSDGNEGLAGLIWIAAPIILLPPAATAAVAGSAAGAVLAGVTTSSAAQ